MRIGIGTGIEYGKVLSSAPAFVGILDLYPSATVAYSLRKLRASYSGSAVRIRRSGDNSEFDFGFDSLGNFDSAAAQAFCIAGGGSQNGFIVTWYDQSTNGYNITQSTGANQPQIISSGVIITKTGGGSGAVARAALQFNGGQNMSHSFASTQSQPASIFAVSENDSAPFGSIFGNDFQQSNRAGVSYQFIANTVGTVALTTDNSNDIITSFILNGASSKARINAGTQLTGNAGTQAQNSLVIGSGNYFGFFTGTFQEYIQWPTDQSGNETGIRDNINDYYKKF